LSASGRVVLGITGASGAIYGVCALQRVATAFDEVYAIISPPAAIVLKQELGLTVDPERPSAEGLGLPPLPNVRFLGHRDFLTPPASGSFRHEGMLIAPCSMGTVGRIAHGVSDDLITRAADVALKERRRLVLLIRESPLSLVHLRNLVAVTEAGAIVLPASPSFYFGQTTVNELVDGVVRRALQCLGRPDPDAMEWGL